MEEMENNRSVSQVAILLAFTLAATGRRFRWCDHPRPGQGYRLAHC